MGKTEEWMDGKLNLGLLFGTEFFDLKTAQSPKYQMGNLICSSRHGNILALLLFSSGRKPWREGVIEKEGKAEANEDHTAQHVAPVDQDGCDDWGDDDDDEGGGEDFTKCCRFDCEDPGLCGSISDDFWKLRYSLSQEFVRLRGIENLSSCRYLVCMNSLSRRHSQSWWKSSNLFLIHKHNEEN